MVTEILKLQSIKMLLAACDASGDFFCGKGKGCTELLNDK